MSRSRTRHQRSGVGRAKTAAASIRIAVAWWNKAEREAARERLLAIANKAIKERRLRNLAFVYDRNNPPTRPCPGFPDWWFISGCPVEISRYTSEKGTGRRTTTFVLMGYGSPETSEDRRRCLGL